MNIVQITPGAGGMYCGNCFRDNALVASLRQAGHQALMVPLYLPMTLEEMDSTAGTPIFYSGVNVYLEEKSAWYRRAPVWLHRWLSSPRLLQWAAGRAAKTRPEDVGALTLSMMRGEEGNQARELEELLGWLQSRGRPDVVCLSNALLLGLARRLKIGLRAPVVCMLQGEDSFLDALREPYRRQVWQAMAERARDVDRFIAPSRYFADQMTRRLELDPDRVRVVFNGINLDGYAGEESPDAEPEVPPPAAPVLGYFARMCREKGLDTLVEAFLELKRRDRVPGLRLCVGGGCGPSDQAFVDGLRDRLRAAGVLGEATFHPNVTREQKIALMRTMTVMSVPALYGEAFGLYLIEAMAAGVPVVQPRHAAFPELLEHTGGGVICEPGDPVSLADAVESLLLKPERARHLARNGREAVLREFSVESMRERMLGVYGELLVGGAKPS